MKFIAISALLAGSFALSGCTALDELGRPPALSPVGAGAVPTALPAHHYPTETKHAPGPHSLWQDRKGKFFTDPRALNVGDILTVRIALNDEASFVNESERSRQSGRSLGLFGTFSAGGSGSSASAEGDINSDSTSTGTGSTERSESLELVMAAVVTGKLPNGNLRISGTQEVRVNAELRVLTLAGIVRPVDIGPNNTISYERIAEARISYGGRGRLTEVQQPPYGQQILDTVLPF